MVVEWVMRLGTDNPENNAIQAAGIEGLPLNQNPAELQN